MDINIVKSNLLSKVKKIQQKIDKLDDELNAKYRIPLENIKSNINTDDVNWESINQTRSSISIIDNLDKEFDGFERAVHGQPLIVESEPDIVEKDDSVAAASMAASAASMAASTAIAASTAKTMAAAAKLSASTRFDDLKKQISES